MYEDNPRMHIEDLLEEVLFPDSTLGWNIAGPREIIRTVPREKLVAYRDAYYVPKRMAVVVAGDISSELRADIERLFGSIKEPAEALDKSFEAFRVPEKLATPLALQSKNTEQVQLGLAFHGLNMKDPLRPAATVLATVLGGTMSSRLFIQVRERRGLCYSINASHQSLDDTGVFTIMSGLEKTRLEEAIKVIWEELEKTVSEPVGEEELTRAKDHLHGKTILSMEDSSEQANWYGKLWLYGEPLVSPEERLAEIAKVTSEDVMAVAKRLFDTKHMAASVIGPFEDRAKLEAIFPFSS
jgi:predicted Zn-dependent peptidase